MAYSTLEQQQHITQNLTKELPNLLSITQLEITGKILFIYASKEQQELYIIEFRANLLAPNRLIYRITTEVLAELFPHSLIYQQQILTMLLAQMSSDKTVFAYSPTIKALTRIFPHASPEQKQQIVITLIAMLNTNVDSLVSREMFASLKTINPLLSEQQAKTLVLRFYIG